MRVPYAIRCCECAHSRQFPQFKGNAAYRCVAKPGDSVPCVARNHGDCLLYESKVESRKSKGDAA